MNFIRKLNRGSCKRVQIWWPTRGMELQKSTNFQLNISKIMTAMPQYTVNTTIAKHETCMLLNPTYICS